MAPSLCSTFRSAAQGAPCLLRSLPAYHLAGALDLATLCSASTVAVALISAVALASMGGS